MSENEIEDINGSIAKISMYTIIHDYIDRVAKERLKPDLITYNNDDITRAFSEYFVNASDPKFNRLYFKLPAIWSSNAKTPTTICVKNVYQTLRNCIVAIRIIINIYYDQKVAQNVYPTDPIIVECYIDKLDTVEHIVDELQRHINIGLEAAKKLYNQFIEKDIDKIVGDELVLTYNSTSNYLIISNNCTNKKRLLDYPNTPRAKDLQINCRFETISNHDPILIKPHYRTPGFEQKPNNALLNSNIAIDIFTIKFFTGWLYDFFSDTLQEVFITKVFTIPHHPNNIVMTSSLSEYDPKNFLACIQ
jgi:hypothetical protein